MFYQTYTARKPLKVPVTVHSCHPITLWRPQNGPVCCPSFAAHATRLTVHCQWRCRSSFPSFIPGDLDLWPWHSNSSERGAKHVFYVNLAQIRSAVPETFHTKQTKKVANSIKNRTLLACGN